MTTLSVYDWDVRADIALDVRFTKGSGRWNVVRADNGRHLGWLCKHTDGTKEQAWPGGVYWSARVGAGAFRGTGPDDEGDVLDDVADRLTNRYNGGSQAVGYGANRVEAAEELLRYLRKNRAPAVGYGAHYDVRPWRNR